MPDLFLRSSELLQRTLITLVNTTEVSVIQCVSAGVCPESKTVSDYGSFVWPSTVQSSSAYLPCPYGPSAVAANTGSLAYRLCIATRGGANWSQPTYTNCRMVEPSTF